MVNNPGARQSHQVQIGYLQVVAGVALFSSSGVIIKLLGLPAPVIVSSQHLLAATVLLAVILVRTSSDRFDLRGQRKLITVMVLLYAVEYLLFVVGVLLIPVANMVTLVYLYPIVTAALAVLLLKERLGRRTLMALVLAVSGTALVLAPSVLQFKTRDLSAAGMGILAALLISFTRILATQFRRSVPTNVINLYIYGCTGLLYSPSLFLMSYEVTVATASLLVLLGVLVTPLAGFLLLSGLRRVEAHRAAVLSYIELPCAALLAWVILGEQPGRTVALGGAVIIAAGLLIVRVRVGPSPPASLP